MKRLRGAVPAAAVLLAAAVFAVSAADAMTKHKRRHSAAPAPAYEPLASRTVAFPSYVDHGSDRNPGGDNLYFTDTKNPNYLVGPGWFQRWEAH